MMPAKQTVLQVAFFKHNLITLSLSLLFLALPVSSTGKSIFLILSVILILTSPACRQKLSNAFANPWCIAAGLLFLIALAACVWSPALFSEKLLVLEKYSKLLYLPILAVGFSHSKSRQLAILAFLAAMTLTAVISVLKYWGLLFFVDIDSGHVFRNHIMTGYMIAFAAYLSAFLAIKTRGKERLAHVFLFCLFSYQLWSVNTGRTGYVIYLILLAIFMVQFLSWRQALLVIFTASFSLAFIYYEHTGVQERVQQVVKDLKNYQNNQKDTSLGYRLQFHAFAKKLFINHPLWGNGTASFTYLFNQYKPVPSWDRRLLEPHSFYWLIAVEFGLIGLAVIAFFFVSLFYYVCRLEKTKTISFAVLIPFLIGNLSDSLLFYSGSGYFFILFMALCLGEGIEKKCYKNVSYL